jgi:hypothetical protein
VKPVYDKFGDEVTDADFDGYQPPAYRKTLARFPNCNHPDHPGCPKCMDDPYDPGQDDFVETEDINDEPVPYYENQQETKQ